MATPYNNVRKRKNNFTGQKQKGSTHAHSTGPTALLAAEYLNYKCAKLGWDLPNPQIGSRPPPSRSKRGYTAYKYVYKLLSEKRFQGRMANPNNNKFITSSGKTPLIAARRLNHRCKEQGIALPNPKIGCEPSPRPMVENRTKFKNVNARNNGRLFSGEVRRKGVRVHASGLSAIICAKRLNYKCKQLGWEYPNPGIGEEKREEVKSTTCGLRYIYKSDGRYKGSKSYGSIKTKTETVTSYGKTEVECAQKLNYLCKEKGWDLPNPKVGVLKPTERTYANGEYRCVYKMGNGYRGSKQHRENNKVEYANAYAKSALMCAQILNYRCKQKGWDLPNPDVGVLNPIEAPSKSWKVIAKRAKKMFGSLED